jgi:hypothetical protein
MRFTKNCEISNRASLPWWCLLLGAAGALLGSASPAPASGHQAKPDAGFEAIDEHALKAPAEAEASLDKLAKYLAEPCKTDREKARVVYRWVTDRIEYDIKGLMTGKPPSFKADAVLKNRKAICEGYATLYADLATRVGVKSDKVSGLAKFQYDPPGADLKHTWNVVLIDKQWKLVDPTFGAGIVSGDKFKKRFRELFFLTPPETLALTHFPYVAKWQLVKKPLTVQQFMKQPSVSIELLELGVSPDAVLTQGKAENFREFALAYTNPNSNIKMLEGPLARYLQAGKEYSFVIQSAEYSDFMLFSTTAKHRFTKDGDVFRLSVQLQKGKWYLGGTRAKGADSPILLEYTVE